MSKNYNFGWSNQVPVQIHVLFEFELFLFLRVLKRFSALPVNEIFSRVVQEVFHKKYHAEIVMIFSVIRSLHNGTKVFLKVSYNKVHVL